MTVAAELCLIPKISTRKKSYHYIREPDVPGGAFGQDVVHYQIYRLHLFWVNHGHQAGGIGYVIHINQNRIKSVKTSFKSACNKAGLEDVTPHVLRHTAISWRMHRRVPTYEIAKLVGHSSPQMIERVYGHLSPDHLKDAKERWYCPRHCPKSLYYTMLIYWKALVRVVGQAGLEPATNPLWASFLAGKTPAKLGFLG